MCIASLVGAGDPASPFWRRKGSVLRAPRIR